MGVERWALKEPKLLKLLNRADDLVEIGPVTRIEFRMEELAIGADFKCAAAGWNQGQRFDAFTEFENFRRQTDGLGRVVSNHAILDRDLGFHWTISFPSEIICATTKRVKKW